MRNIFLDAWAKFQFWKAKRTAVSEKDYKFALDLSRPDSFTVEIVSNFPRTIVEYSNISMGENGYLHFDVSVVSNPLNHDLESKKFNEYVGHIMRSVVASSVKNAEKFVNENRTVDTGELDEERTLSEEGSSVHEKRVPKRKPRKKTVRRD